MKCHYIIYKNEKILIPYCMAVVLSENIEDCTCNNKVTKEEKRELALKKIKEFEYGYDSALELNKMVKLFIQGYNEAESKK